MTIECYYGNCRFHGTHGGDEGPFCFEEECKATEHEIKLLEQIRKTERTALCSKVTNDIKGEVNMFKKEVVIECTASDIEQLVMRHYPQYVDYELYAYEEHDNAVMVKHVVASDVGEYEKEDFESGKAMYMANTLLDKLCFDGFLEPGKYLIDGTW